MPLTAFNFNITVKHCRYKERLQNEIDSPLKE